jgi:hypothetical protein
MDVMDRRDFVRLAALGLLAGRGARPAPPAPAAPRFPIERWAWLLGDVQNLDAW